jgi:hypothetical protein
MAAIFPSQEAMLMYRERIRRLADCNIAHWPGLTSLRIYTELSDPCRGPPEISIVNIPKEEGLASELSITNLNGHIDLFGQISSLADTSPFSQLIIVENICPNSLALLGAAYDIDPQFFADHVNVLSWYRMFEAVPESSKAQVTLSINNFLRKSEH